MCIASVFIHKLRVQKQGESRGRNNDKKGVKNTRSRSDSNDSGPIFFKSHVLRNEIQVRIYDVMLGGIMRNLCMLALALDSSCSP